MVLNLILYLLCYSSVPDIKLKDVEQCFSGCQTDPINGVKACHSNLDKCDRPGNGTAQNLRFSPYDILYLNNIYPSETQTMTSEQITVKFFNDIYGEQINPDELSRQLKLTAEREKNSKPVVKEGLGDIILAPIHALKEKFEDNDVRDDIVNTIIGIFICLAIIYLLIKFVINYFEKKNKIEN